MKRPDRLWMWISMIGMTLAVMLPLAVIWDRLPVGSGVLVHGSGGNQRTYESSVDVDKAAEQLGTLLRKGLFCAGKAAALLSTAKSRISRPEDVLALIRPQIGNCLDERVGLEQVFILTSVGDPGHALAVRDDREAKLGLQDARYLSKLQEADSTKSDTYALSPNGKDGIDQIVPVRGVDTTTILVFRYRLLRAVQDQQIPPSFTAHSLALVDERSTARGIPIRGTRGLWIALPGDLNLRWLLSSLTLALLLLGSAGVYWTGRSHRQYQEALRGKIDQLVEKDQQLKAEAAVRRDIEDSVNVGLYVVDRAGTLASVNREFCSLSGWPEDKLLHSQPPYPFWPSEELESRREHLASIMGGQMLGEDCQFSFVRPDGQGWTAEVRASALGSGGGWIFSCADITQDMENQKRNEALHEELRKRSDLDLLAEQAGQFLHKMSGHAGACMNACDGMRSFLKSGRHEKLAEGAELASKAAHEMHDVIERFRPRLRAEPLYEATQLWEVAADSMAQQSAFAASRNVKLVNIVSPDLPLQRVDRHALREVLINLISNGILAMANTSLPNRTLILQSDFDEDRAMVELLVRDRGCGIVPELWKKVFEQGYTTRKGGTGWGLFISRKWVERMGGKLEIRDSSRSGTDMVIALPLRPEEE